MPHVHVNGVRPDVEEHGSCAPILRMVLDEAVQLALSLEVPEPN